MTIALKQLTRLLLGIVFFDRLAALGALGEVDLDTNGFRLGHLVHGSDFACHAVKRCFIELALG